MSLTTIHPDLVTVALDRTDGSSFELFVNQFYPAIAGASFVPLGGMKDGGADAYETPIHEDQSRSDRFYQASIEKDVEAKIRRTAARLREFGRTPRSVTHVTPHVVRYMDRVEADLSDELGLQVLIRDGNYIKNHVNDDAQTIAAFNNRLRFHTDFLKGVGKSTIVPASTHVKSPAVFVFLAQELGRRDGDFRLVNAMTDALILWALEGTDPDVGILRSRDEVLSRIGAELPGVRTLVERRLSKRLNAMSSKTYPGGRAIRAHQKDGLYCLPFETRIAIEAESAADEALLVRFRESLEARVAAEPRPGLGDAGAASAVQVAKRAIQLTFETQGLEFASFLQKMESATSGFPTITDAIGKALTELGHSGVRGNLIGEAALSALRGVLYSSEDTEREYLHKLSLTYALLFTLNTEPRLIEYFENLAGDFYLYVGSDVLLRALSEHFLAEQDQMTRNTLLMAARQGATLVLTQPVLNEVVSHLRVSDLEYKNHIAQREDHLPYEIVRDVPPIMLRAYLYAHTNAELGDKRPRNWQGFVNKFCDHADLHRDSAFEDLRRYLCGAFSMQYRSRVDLANYFDAEEVERVTESLAPQKKKNVLAEHDAIMASTVYGRRVKRRETATASEFGLSTWWLTGETSILRHTRDLVRKHRAQYMMRPDFLLNFLTLAPKAHEVRATFKTVFPGLLGVSLGRRMDVEAFHEVMDQVAEASELDDARRAAQMAKIVDKLKGDASKRFHLGVQADSIDVAAERYQLSLEGAS